MAGKSLLAIVLVAAVMAVGHWASLSGRGRAEHSPLRETRCGQAAPTARSPSRGRRRSSPGPCGRTAASTIWRRSTSSASKGVTPENNAAVPLIQAFGPSAIDKDLREPFFKMLGIGPCPSEGKYYVDFRDFAKLKGHKPREEKAALAKTPEEWKAAFAKSQAEGKAALAKTLEELKAAYAMPPESDSESSILAQWYHAMERPWSKEEFPLVAAWLERNREADRSHRRSVAPDAVLCALGLLGRTGDVQGPRLADESNRAARRRYAPHPGDAQHQSRQGGRGVGRSPGVPPTGPTVRPRPVARRLPGRRLWIERIAQEGDVVLVSHGHLSAERAKRFGDELRSSADGPVGRKHQPPRPVLLPGVRVARRSRRADRLV